MHLFLKKRVQEPDVLLKWRHMTWEWEPLIWIQVIFRLARKRALKIQPEYWEECLMVSNIVDLAIQDRVEELAKHAGVPVWNGLTNEYHPTQMLADMLTIREHFGTFEGIILYTWAMQDTIWVTL